ncbi:hypothetical protein PVAP13_8NG342532 [Panicum virgatum]|uniref:Uncharacterized protein n=1 Tax=Panicum virgatum TaxID=38727 RepID=A0A8T0PAX4_PANVG|nr:hypothetical protein PVAP13_8NG342532 [Panicum virgatum]
MAFGGSAGDSGAYSAAATVVRLYPPLPLLRAPVPSPTPCEAPVLAFRDAAAWDTAEASLVSRCEVTFLIALSPPRSHLRCKYSHASRLEKGSTFNLDCLDCSVSS